MTKDPGTSIEASIVMRELASNQETEPFDLEKGPDILHFEPRKSVL